MRLDDLLKKWLGTEGGAERANYQMFLTELCQALELPAPNPKGAGLGDYQFEAPVKSEAALGTKGTGRIDLYKRDHFILEAKQSQLKPGEPLPADLPEAPPVIVHDLFGNPIGTVAAKGRQLPRYDRLMADARVQAERYALALPDDHRTPPFLIVADIGRSFELYFDWAGNGRGYGPFPDERNYRVVLADLASGEKIPGLDKTAAQVFQAIWTDPASIDPRLKAVAVTRDIAERLSRVAAQLEKDQRNLRPGDAEIALGIEATSLFLMRMLFCMFAEDVELLPKDSFKRFLADAKDRSDLFWRNGLTELWSKMNDAQELNRYWSPGDATIRYFNGNLFAGTQIYNLPAEFKGELLVAADKDWRAVEPAIFGTLLEQVLTAKDRAKLGAHYTPRAYVERLVQATIMDVLGPEWDAVLTAARASADAGDTADAIAKACAFHARLVAIRVLDPACGTGNFLYVAMDALLRLETDIRQFVIGLGGTLEPAVLPDQFLGLELNPRAAVIAELVLWIGWLRYRLANTPEAIGEPVLPRLHNINEGTHGGYDAVLVRTATGEPDAENPRRPIWPEADFIVGNPPFIAGKDIRDVLGSDYAEALWMANPNVPKSADFVMQWWDRAADILTRARTRLKRFGFVTTNSITQVFSRRVIEEYLKGPLHLALAIPDHPWTRVTKDAAAVRIAMTVAAAGAGEGRLVKIASAAKLDSDEPELVYAVDSGLINPKLRLDADSSAVVRLKANRPFRIRGVEFHGDGYVISDQQYGEWRLENPPFYEEHVHPYTALNDYKIGRQSRFVIDLYGVSEKELRTAAPTLYQHLLKTAYPSRKANNMPFRRDNWWMLALPHTELREGLSYLKNYVVTPVTSKHRWYVREAADTFPDQSLIAILLDDWGIVGVLASKIHEEWFYENCGWLGVGNDPRYNPTRVFDTFPFPNLTPDERTNVGEIAEELDSTRRTVLAENPSLNMTGLYNLVLDIRTGATLTPAREATAVKARARIIAKLHDDLDAAIADAYGWGEEWRRAPLPPGEIIARLLVLNAERAAEEQAGHVRWLRPDYLAATSPP